MPCGRAPLPRCGGEVDESDSWEGEVDIMIAGDRAWHDAKSLREYITEFGVNYGIHARRIWWVERSSEGWRSMEDRGSVTANHNDQVHVTTY